MIEADAPDNYQQVVTFSDGERLLINNADLADAIVSESSGWTYPKEYSEAIVALEERHKQELEQLFQELRIGLQAEAGAKAEAQVQEQINLCKICTSNTKKKISSYNNASRRWRGYGNWKLRISDSSSAFRN